MSDGIDFECPHCFKVDRFGGGTFKAARSAVIGRWCRHCHGFSLVRIHITASDAKSPVNRLATE
jgi:hypothetical protein